MKSTNRTFLTLTEIEPRIVPDATATLLPETIGSTSTTATTLQYVDDPSHPITATTLGFADDPSHPITATPLTAALPPSETVVTPTPDVSTAILPPTDTAASPTTTPEVLALPPEFLAWIETLSDEELQSLLALSDADLAAVLFGPTAPESPVTPVAGPSLPADITVTLHGVEVGTSPPTPAANPTVVNTVFQIDPNAPPPTATTLEFTDGQAGQGPLVTLASNPVAAPPINPPQPAINPPQIVVGGDAPPVVQVAAPAANAVQVGVPTSIRPGDEWLYNTTANGMFVPFMTKTAYAAMIAAGNITNATPPAGFWSDVGDWIPFNQSIPYIVGTATSGYVWNYVFNNPIQTKMLIDVGFAQGVNNVFIQPVVRTALLVGELPIVLYDPTYVPNNPHLAGYLDGSRTHGGAFLSIALDATSMVGTGLIARSAIRGAVASRAAIAADAVETALPSGPATVTVPGGPAYTVTTPVPGGPAFTVTTPVPRGPAFTVTTTPVPGIPVSPLVPIAGGMSAESAGDATRGMNRGGGHAIRHLEGTLIPNTGSLASRVDAFSDVVRPILQNPDHVAAWNIGGVNGTAYIATTSNGRQIAVIIANEGPYAGKVLSAFFPDANQLAIMLGR